jgi:hypothetical protein
MQSRGRMGSSGVSTGRGRYPRLAMAIGAVTLCMLAFVATASAGLRKDFSVFNDCPVNAPGASACLVSYTTSGEFKLGSKDVTVNKTITLQGAFTKASPFLIPAADGNTLSKTPLTVPGGLVGIEGLGGEVTATAELAQPVKLELENLGSDKPAIYLPLKVKLSNPALGEACYVGSNSEPVSLQLTTGTTNPPPPNKPITGNKGTPAFFDNNKIIVLSGASLVDNSFAAPGVNGCGGIASLLIDPVVDLDAGLPAAAGSNTAILNSSFETTPVSVLQAYRALPELGRCVKVEAVKEGRERVFHGHYYAADCVEEDPLHGSKFEWIKGAGAGSKFTGISGKTTLATATKQAITCSGTSTSGEYTGLKTATATITMTGCANPATKQSCQSGTAPGEIVTSSLAGELGFIEAEYEGQALKVSVGLDLKHAPTLLTARCGEEAVAVSGSVIAPIGKADKMTSTFGLSFKAAGGKQIPEAFEEEPKDTLTSTVKSGAGEAAAQAGLTSSASITNEEKLEIKAAAE